MTQDERGTRTCSASGIGAFAARARLSATALRLHDRLGLLRPAYVDGAGGCRHHRAGRTERARPVTLLRRLDMPPARIAGTPAEVTPPRRTRPR